MHPDNDIVINAREDGGGGDLEGPQLDNSFDVDLDNQADNQLNFLFIPEDVDDIGGDRLNQPGWRVNYPQTAHIFEDFIDNRRRLQEFLSPVAFIVYVWTLISAGIGFGIYDTLRAKYTSVIEFLVNLNLKDRLYTWIATKHQEYAGYIVLLRNIRYLEPWQLFMHQLDLAIYPLRQRIAAIRRKFYDLRFLFTIRRRLFKTLIRDLKRKFFGKLRAIKWSIYRRLRAIRIYYSIRSWFIVDYIKITFQQLFGRLIRRPRRFLKKIRKYWRKNKRRVIQAYRKFRFIRLVFYILNVFRVLLLRITPDPLLSVCNFIVAVLMIPYRLYLLLSGLFTNVYRVCDLFIDNCRIRLVMLRVRLMAELTRRNDNFLQIYARIQVLPHLRVLGQSIIRLVTGAFFFVLRQLRFGIYDPICDYVRFDFLPWLSRALEHYRIRLCVFFMIVFMRCSWSTLVLGMVSFPFVSVIMIAFSLDFAIFLAIVSRFMEFAINNYVERPELLVFGVAFLIYYTRYHFTRRQKIILDCLLMLIINAAMCFLIGKLSFLFLILAFMPQLIRGGFTKKNVNADATWITGVVTRLSCPRKDGSVYQSELGFIWNTIGDGFCGIHVCYCFLKNFNYLALMQNILATKRLSSFTDAFLRPEINRFLKSESQKLISDEDRKLLRTFAEGGRNPSGLEYGTILVYCKFLGVPEPYLWDIRKNNTADCFATWKKATVGEKNQNMKDIRKAFPEESIAWNGSHFEYVTRDMIKQNANPFVEGWEAVKKLNPDLDKAKMDDFMKTQTETEREMFNLRQKANKASEKVDAAKEAISKTEDKNKALEELIGKTMVKQEEVKYAEKTKIFIAEKSGEICGIYTHNFTIGPVFTSLLSTKNYKLFEKAHPYAHAGLRILADSANVNMLTAGFRFLDAKKGIVVEHAAKCHKTTKWLKDGLNARYEYTRPIVLEDTDAEYRNRFRSYMKNRPYIDMRVAECLDAQKNRLADNYQVLTDVIYYPETFTALASHADTVGSFSAGNYPRTPGTYYYYDDEGYCKIFSDGTMINCPRDNGHGYSHDLISLPARNFSYYVADYERFINCTVVNTTQTGEHTSYTEYSFTVSEEQVFPVFDDIFDRPNPVTIEVTDQIFSGMNRAVNGELTGISRLVTGLREIIPNYHFYSYLEKNFIPKMTNFTANVDQLTFKLTEYRKDSAHTAWNYKPGDTELFETAIFFMQNKAANYRLLTAGLETPRMFDVFRTKLHLIVISPLITFVSMSLARAFRMAGVPERWNSWQIIHNGLVRWGQYYTIFHAILELWNGFTPAIERFMDWDDGSLRVPVVVLVNEVDFDQDANMPTIRFRGGFKKEHMETVDDYNNLATIREIHYIQSNSKRFYHAVGNKSLYITKEGRKPICTCKDFSYQKVIQMDTPIHFGSCELNLDAALKARAFNTHVEANVNIMKDFSFFVKMWLERNRLKIQNFIFNVLTSEDMSFETFMAGTDPKKRKLYASGIKFLQESNRDMDWRYEFFVKPNEVHFEPLREVRPRLIANPSIEVKAGGAYLARLMIKTLKHIEPGFISGYNLNELSDKMMSLRENGRFHDNNCYSYDGSSHDAHQNYAAMESVDVLLLRTMIPMIMSRSDCIIPKHRETDILHNGTNLFKHFYTNTRKRGIVCATVFSGDPFSTTLFNTLRTILYNRYVAWTLDPFIEKFGSFWAAGDDVLVHWPIKPDAKVIKTILGSEGGRCGLGQNAKDFLIGKLESHTFLSKHFLVQSDVVELLPVTNRLYKAGTSYNVRSSINKDEHRLAIMVSQGFLPKCLSAFTDRFKAGPVACMTKRMQRYFESLKFDYSFQMKMNTRPFNSRLEAEAYSYTDKKYLVKLASDSRDVKSYMSVVGGSTLLTSETWNGCLRKINNRNMVKIAKINPKKKMRPTKRRPRPVKKESDWITIKPEPPRSGTFRPKLFGKHWTTAFLANSENYALGLHRPKDQICLRIPQAMPVSTAVMSQKGTYTATASPTGFLVVAMDPNANQVFHYNSAVTLTSTSALGLATNFPVNSLITSSNVSRFRTVSAWIGVSDMTPAINRTGTILVGSAPRALVWHGSSTYDTLYDISGGNQFPLASMTKPAGSVYLPLDSSCGNFINVGSVTDGYEVPFVFISACAPNAQIVIEYHINWEFIPNPGQTDLLSTDKSKIGTMDNGLMLAGHIKDLKRGHLPHHGVQKTIFEKIDFVEVATNASAGFAAGGPMGAVIAGAGTALRHATK